MNVEGPMKTRRDVMMGGAALAAAAAFPAMAADARPQSPLGVAQTALGHYFRRQRGGAQTRGPADPIATVAYVRSLGAGGLQMAVPNDTDVKKLRAALEKNNLFFEGDIRMIARAGDDTAAFEKGLRMYKELGASCVRTVSFVGRRYETFKTLGDYLDWKANADGVLAACVPIADKVGIPLAMENHKDRVVDEEVEVLRKYSSEYFGALVDFGNNISMCDDPVETIRKLAPYVKATHVKNMAVAPYDQGFLLSEVLFEDGFLDIPALFAELKKVNPKVHPMHELITRDPLKVPVLTDQYWATWPERSGLYLERTLRMVEAHASKKPLPTIDDLDADAQFQVEQSNNLKCFAWGRKALA
jgi:sugar phosphate isomerase/epimerase